MKKIPNRQISLKAVSAKKRRFNTIQTDEDWDQKQQRRNSAYQRFHTQTDHITSTNQSMYDSSQLSHAHSTKNKTKKSFKWEHVVQKRSEHSTIKKRNLSEGKSNTPNQPRPKSNCDGRSGKKGRSGSRPRKSLCKSPKFNGNKKKMTTPAINFRDFETFEPKQQFLEGFTPLVKVIDEAGCSVWQARKNTDKLTYLVKQSSSPKQIQLFKLFQLPGGKFKRQFLRNLNVRTLPRLLDEKWDQSSQTGNIYNVWLVFDCLDQIPLHNALYKTSYQNSVLQVDYKLVYREMMRSPQMVKRLIAEASRALALLADKGLVHGRIRPSSIYVNAKGKALANVRIHGFQNWFYFKDFQKSLPMLANQYSPPQILNYLLFDSGVDFDRKMIEYLEDYQYGWVIDVWSLGIVLLEFFLGYPLALRPEKVCIQGETLQPIFNPQDSISDIIEKQMEIVYNLDKILSEKVTSCMIQSEPLITRDLQLQYLLKRMLSIDPKKRISPAEIVHLLK